MFSKLFKGLKKVDDALFLPSKRFSFMVKEEQLKFQDEVTRYFAKKGPNFIPDFSKGLVSSSSSEVIYGLDNIAQIYHKSEEKYKTRVVQEYFDKILNSEEESSKLLKNRNDFNKIKNILKLRLYPSTYDISAYEMIVWRHDLEDVYTTIVFDLPNVTENVKNQDCKIWGVKKDELFSLALSNTIENKLRPTELELRKGLKVWAFEGKDIYTTTSVLNLIEYPRVIGKYGSLVIVPNREIFSVYPINDLDVLQMLNILPVVATNMYKDGPGSITKNIYWYKDGDFINIPYQYDEKKINIRPPDEFVELLNKISEKEDK